MKLEMNQDQQKFVEGATWMAQNEIKTLNEMLR